MRPYYAVIKDSFREALSSRVLWILLVLATLLLATIVPLSITDNLPASLEAGNITSVASLAVKLHDAGQADKETPGKRVWSRLPSGLRERMTKFAAKPDDRAAAEVLEPSVRGDLNQVLSQRDLYEEAAWASANAKPNSEARALIDRGVDRLSEDEVRRLNRLLLEAAFPLEISQAAPAESAIQYFGLIPGTPFRVPLTKNVLVTSLLASFSDIVVGAIGVFVAILVTASIVPQTFEAGAIDLLLSKPISRFWLFVAKWVGGCAFTLLNAAYVLGGLWLIAGLRYGVWSGRLLMCIPVFMFVFAIYYAVSALAGVIWKNAIICVVLSIFFWAACFVLSLSKNSIELAVLNARRLVGIAAAGDTTLAVNETGQLKAWQASSASWQSIDSQDAKGRSDAPPVPFGAPFRTIGPIYDATRKQLVVARPPGGNAFMSQTGVLYAGRQDDDWLLTRIVAVPAGTTGLFASPNGDVITVGSSGVFKLEGASAAAPAAAVTEGDSVETSVPPAISSTTKSAAATFIEVGPAAGFGGQVAGAMDPATGGLAVLSRGQLRLLKADGKGKYTQAARADIGDERPAIVGFGGSSVIVVLADGTIKWFDGENLSLREEFTSSSPRTPRFALVSPNGRWLAVLFHNGRLWLYDAERQSDASKSIAGQGEISAIAFGPDGELLVAQYFTEVNRYNLDPIEVVARIRPEVDSWELAYWYFIRPVHKVFPKPGELGNVVSYLLSGQDSQSTSGREDDLASARLKIDVWGPIWSNLAFTVVVVCLGGLYTAYKDF